ncbi:DUF4962 domain-containing protein [Piscinibacter sakaiensis]|uniref:DUF4962 domain-containing protein n=1 Tax=Piscinibacter sakaiensis TaxID=1547922 RepID=UPI003AAE7127
MSALRTLEQPATGRLTLQPTPRPDAPPTENPPRFAWIPDIDAGAQYSLRVRQLDGNGAEYITDGLRHNFHTPDRSFEPGRYAWSYALWSPTASSVVTAWSAEREFVLEPGLTHAPAMRHQDRYAGCEMAHPRLWLNPRERDAMVRAVGADRRHLGWDSFFETAVRPWIDRELIAEPQRYPGNKRTPALWRKMYIDCQELLYAVRHLAVAAKVQRDPALLETARSWLLHIAGFDLNGATALAYNDEAAFRIAGALAWGYDWLYDDLSEDERRAVREALSARLEDVAVHVIDHARIHLFPYDSHAVRSVASVMVPACIALLGEHPRAQEWLDFAIDYYDTLYSPWGGADGGWAEGPHYWTTAMAYLIDAGNLLRKYAGHDIYQRVFFQKTGAFPLYTKAPDTTRCCFGDDSTLGDLPSLKVGYNIRHFAALTGDGHLQWYFEKICELAKGTEGEFYNYGWWSFAFDELQYRHDWPQVDAVEPHDLPLLRHFKDVGWVAVQRDLHDADEHLQFVTKCSSFGSISHSHGDQGAFLLFAHREELAIQSGYYIGFGTSMHRNWRRLTKSKNAILIDGNGQYAGADKAKQIQAVGRVLEAREEGDGTVFISLDPSAAYRLEVPYLRSYRRDFHLIRGRHLVVVDEVELEQPGQIQWLMQLIGAPQIGQSSFRYEGEHGGITGEFVFSSSGPVSLSTVEGFDDVDPAEWQGLPPHHRVIATTRPARSHRLVTALTPYRIGRSERLHHFIDDQGYSTAIYFQDAQDRSHSIILPKQF